MMMASQGTSCPKHRKGDLWTSTTPTGSLLWAAIRPPADHVLILDQLRKPYRSRRIRCCPRQSAALFELPFELFSVALLIHDGTLLFMRRRNRSITEIICRLDIFPRLPAPRITCDLLIWVAEPSEQRKKPVPPISNLISAGIAISLPAEVAIPVLSLFCLAAPGIPKCLSRARQTRHDSADREGCDIRNLMIGEHFDFAQNQYFAERARHCI
jgi:hypothetical protein